MGDDNLLPLLKKDYYENCPGCKVDQLKNMQSGLPIKQLLFMWMVVLGTALSISSLFPFLYFMIRDFGIAEKEEDIGYYAGFVGSSYQLGRAVTSILWGVLADKYGRKPVIIIGTASVVIFNTLFGLSVNFWMAIVTRFLLGCFNGLLGPIKAYACEIFREEHQALGLSTVSTAWGIGLIIGPALGGFLAQPADKYPSIFSKYSVFGKFPYFLPCLTISTFALIVTISCFFIPETLHKHAKREFCEEIGTNVKGKSEEEDGNKPRKSLLMNWPLMSSIAVYCIFSLHDMAYLEIFSLWAESPKRNGGLSYTTDMVGGVLSFTGFALLVSQLSLYSKLEKAFGAITTARVAGVLSIPLLTIYPFMAHLSGLSLSISLNIASALMNVFSICIITGMYILQNRAVEQDRRGAANGIAMTLMSMCKAIGPAGGGVLFSWAQKRQNTTFLPGNHMVFFVLNIIEAVGVFATFKPFLVERQH